MNNGKNLMEKSRIVDKYALFGVYISMPWHKLQINIPPLLSEVESLGRFFLTAVHQPSHRPENLGYVFSSPPLFDADLISKYLFLKRDR